MERGALGRGRAISWVLTAWSPKFCLDQGLTLKTAFSKLMSHLVPFSPTRG